MKNYNHFLNENKKQIKKDDRKLSWSDIEDNVQRRYKNKDKDFKLSGDWKNFKEEKDGYKVFVVDGEWVRNNLSIIFGHGGHGVVHEFIPIDEIWVGEYKLNGKKASKDYLTSCIVHEIHECEMMKRGENFWASHQSSLEKEKELGLLTNKEISE